MSLKKWNAQLVNFPKPASDGVELPGGIHVVTLDHFLSGSETVFRLEGFTVCNAFISAELSFSQRLHQKLVELKEARQVLSFGEFEIDAVNGETFIEVEVHIPREHWLEDGGLAVMSSLTEVAQEGYILTPRIYPAPEERAV